MLGDLRIIKPKSLLAPAFFPSGQTVVPMMFENLSGLSWTTFKVPTVATVITKTSQNARNPFPVFPLSWFMQIVLNKSMLTQGPQVQAGKQGKVTL